MKKTLFVLLWLVCLFSAWCDNSNIVEIDSENWSSNEWLSVEDAFNQQIEQAQYISDMNDFISYRALSISEDKPFTSEFIIDAIFDKESSLQGWLEISQKKYSKSNDYETSNITFDINLMESENDPEPIQTSWELSLLYQDDEMYANVHSFDLFMWEWNSAAKMYKLMSELLIGKWISLEVKEWKIMTVDTNSDTKFWYIISTLKTVLKTQDIHDSPNFLNAVVEMIDFVNSYVNLWISTNELTLQEWEFSFSELWQWIVQKTFTWSFKWKDSAFELSFVASKNWLEIHLYNIKEYDEDRVDYVDKELDFYLSIQEAKKSEYDIDAEYTKLRQKIFEMKWKIRYADSVQVSGSFALEPMKLIEWQKISWKIEWNIEKHFGVDDTKFPVLSGDILSISELLSSFWVSF